MACAQRYLGISHGLEWRGAHDRLVDAVRAIARRSGERAWRLVGVTMIRRTGPHVERPTLQDFAHERGLDGWSEADQLEMLEAAFPMDRRSQRHDRLRQRQVDMLRRLEEKQAQHPRPSDRVSDWFDEVTASRLSWAGHHTLQDVAKAIAAGGRWYATMPGVGQAKGRRIASYLLTLIPAALPPERPHFVLRDADALTSIVDANPLPGMEDTAHFQPYQTPQASTLPSRIDPPSATVWGPVSSAERLLDADTDMQAVQAWIRARCKSEATAKSYLREARRLMLWLSRERFGKPFSAMRVEDCLAYQAFLQHIPPGWISRNRHAPGELGWAPFRGPLTPLSQRFAITVLGGLFAWLSASRYLQGNPWMLVNSDVGGMDQVTQALDTKAISDGALEQIRTFLQAQTPSPSLYRIEFIVSFIESVGLRSAELLQARLGDFSRQPEGWTMRVVGKGSKVRTVFVPRPAFDAMQTYLARRGLIGIEAASPDAPLLASAIDPRAAVGYQTLYMTVKRWFAKAISAADLSFRERTELAGASTHWLRHTFGTKAVAREVPYDVIQQQLGHASVSTTMGIYARAPLKRRAEELSRAFT
jgi:integrase